MDIKSSLVLLDGDNYGTWKVQVKMCLIKEDLWRIVSGSETAPADANALAKFNIRKDRALATVVLAIKPKFLYLIGDPENPATVWKKLEDVFYKKTWSNKLRLRKKLYGLKLAENGDLQEHLKNMVEIFDGLAAVESPIEEEDKVICLLASLPDKYDTLVTTLETLENVPTWGAVTERLLREEEKRKCGDAEGEKAFISRKPYGRSFRCHECGVEGHLRRNCPNLKARREGTSYAATKNIEEEEIVLAAETGDISIRPSSLKNGFLLDSAATQHMCHDRTLFCNMKRSAEKKVLVGDGKTLDVRGQGDVILKVDTGNGATTRCRLKNVLYVPNLSHNLLSVSKISIGGNCVNFSNNICEIRSNTKIIAFGRKIGNLYVLAEKERFMANGSRYVCRQSFALSATTQRRLIRCRMYKSCTHTTCK